MKKRILSCILAICMTFSLIPSTVTSVFAEGGGELAVLSADTVNAKVTGGITGKAGLPFENQPALTVTLDSEDYKFQLPESAAKATKTLEDYFKVSGSLVEYTPAGGGQKVGAKISSAILSKDGKSVTLYISGTPGTALKTTIDSTNNSTINSSGTLLKVELQDDNTNLPLVKKDENGDFKVVAKADATVTASIESVKVDVAMRATAEVTSRTEGDSGTAVTPPPTVDLIVKEGVKYKANVTVNLIGGKFSSTANTVTTEHFDFGGTLPKGLNFASTKGVEVDASDATKCTLSLEGTIEELEGTDPLKDLKVTVKGGALDTTTKGTPTVDVIAEPQSKARTLNVFKVSYTAEPNNLNVNEVKYGTVSGENFTEATPNAVIDKASGSKIAVEEEAFYFQPTLASIADGYTITSVTYTSGGNSGEAEVAVAAKEKAAAAAVYSIPAGKVTGDVSLVFHTSGAKNEVAFKAPSKDALEGCTVTVTSGGEAVAGKADTYLAAADTPLAFTIETDADHKVDKVEFKPTDTTNGTEFTLEGTNGAYSDYIVEPGSIEITVSAKTYTVTGTVKLNGTTVTAGKEVSIAAPDGSQATPPTTAKVTSRGGVYTINNVPAGEWVVTIEPDTGKTHGKSPVTERQTITVGTANDPDGDGKIVNDIDLVPYYTVELDHYTTDSNEKKYGVYAHGETSNGENAIEIKTTNPTLTPLTASILEAALLGDDEVATLADYTKATQASSEEVPEGTSMTFYPVCATAGKYTVTWYVDEGDGSGYKIAPTSTYPRNDNGSMTTTITKSIKVACTMDLDDTDKSQWKVSVADKLSADGKTVDSATQKTITATVNQATLTANKEVTLPTGSIVTLTVENPDGGSVAGKHHVCTWYKQVDSGAEEEIGTGLTLDWTVPGGSTDTTKTIKISCKESVYYDLTLEVTNPDDEPIKVSVVDDSKTDNFIEAETTEKTEDKAAKKTTYKLQIPGKAKPSFKIESSKTTATPLYCTWKDAQSSTVLKDPTQEPAISGTVAYDQAIAIGNTISVVVKPAYTVTIAADPSPTPTIDVPQGLKSGDKVAKDTECTFKATATDSILKWSVKKGDNNAQEFTLDQWKSNQSAYSDITFNKDEKGEYDQQELKVTVKQNVTIGLSQTAIQTITPTFDNNAKFPDGNSGKAYTGKFIVNPGNQIVDDVNKTAKVAGYAAGAAEKATIKAVVDRPAGLKVEPEYVYEWTVGSSKDTNQTGDTLTLDTLNAAATVTCAPTAYLNVTKGAGDFKIETASGAGMTGFNGTTVKGVKAGTEVTFTANNYNSAKAYTWTVKDSEGEHEKLLDATGVSQGGKVLKLTLMDNVEVSLSATENVSVDFVVGKMENGVFKEDSTLGTITAKGNGSKTGAKFSMDAPAGSTLTLTAAGKANKCRAEWYVGDATNPVMDNPYSFVPSKSTTVKCVITDLYKAEAQTVTGAEIKLGTIANGAFVPAELVDNGCWFPDGTEVVAQVTPTAGYVVEDISVKQTKTPATPVPVTPTTIPGAAEGVKAWKFTMNKDYESVTVGAEVYIPGKLVVNVTGDENAQVKVTAEGDKTGAEVDRNSVKSGTKLVFTITPSTKNLQVSKVQYGPTEVTAEGDGTYKITMINAAEMVVTITIAPAEAMILAVEPNTVKLYSDANYTYPITADQTNGTKLQAGQTIYVLAPKDTANNKVCQMVKAVNSNNTSTVLAEGTPATDNLSDGKWSFTMPNSKTVKVVAEYGAVSTENNVTLTWPEGVTINSVTHADGTAGATVPTNARTMSVAKGDTIKYTAEKADSRLVSLKVNNAAVTDPNVVITNGVDSYPGTYVVREGDSSVTLAAEFAELLTFSWSEYAGEGACAGCGSIVSASITRINGDTSVVTAGVTGQAQLIQGESLKLTAGKPAADTTTPEKSDCTWYVDGNKDEKATTANFTLPADPAKKTTTVEYVVSPSYKVTWNAGTGLNSITAAPLETDETAATTTSTRKKGVEMTFTAHVYADDKTSGTGSYQYIWEVTKGSGSAAVSTPTTRPATDKITDELKVTIDDVTRVTCKVVTLAQISLTANDEIKEFTLKYTADGSPITVTPASGFTGRYTALIDTSKEIEITAVPKTAGKDLFYQWTGARPTETLSVAKIAAGSGVREIVCAAAEANTVTVIAGQYVGDVAFSFYMANPADPDGDWIPAQGSFSVGEPAPDGTSKTWTVKVNNSIEVRLTATPGNVQALGTNKGVWNWTGEGTAKDNTYTIPAAQANKVVNVEYTPTHDFTVNVIGDGSVQYSGTSFDKDSTEKTVAVGHKTTGATFTVTCPEGKVARWFSDAACVNALAGTTKKMKVEIADNGNLTLSEVEEGADLYCKFVDKVDVAVTCPADKGAYAMDGRELSAENTYTYAVGDEVVIKITPKTGFQVQSVKLGTEDMDASGTDAQTGALIYKKTLKDGVNALTVEFGNVPYGISASVAPIGLSVQAPGVQVGADKDHLTDYNDTTKANLGQLVVVTPTPLDGKTVSEVTYSYKVDGADKSFLADVSEDKASYSFTMPAAKVDVLVTYADAAAEHALTLPQLNDVLQGTITATAEDGTALDLTKVKVGTTVKITVTPVTGQQITSLTANGLAVTAKADGENNSVVYTYQMPAEDVTIAATFSARALITVKYDSTVTEVTGKIGSGNAKYDDGEPEEGMTVRYFDLTGESGSFTLTATAADADATFTWKLDNTPSSVTGATYTLGEASSITGPHTVECSSTAVPKFTVSGVVKLNGAIKGGVKVFLVPAEGEAMDTTSDTATGEYKFEKLAVDSAWTLKVEAPEDASYDEWTKAITMSADRTENIDLVKTTTFQLKDQAGKTYNANVIMNNDGTYTVPSLPTGKTGVAAGDFPETKDGEVFVGWTFEGNAGTENAGKVYAVGDKITPVEGKNVLVTAYAAPATSGSTTETDEGVKSEVMPSKEDAKKLTDAAVNAAADGKDPVVAITATKNEDGTPDATVTDAAVDLSKALVDSIATTKTKTEIDPENGQTVTTDVAPEAKLTTDVAEVTLPNVAVEKANNVVKATENASSVRVEVKNTTSVRDTEDLNLPAQSELAASVSVDVKVVTKTAEGTEGAPADVDLSNLGGKSVTIKINVGANHEGKFVAVYSFNADHTLNLGDKIGTTTVAAGGWVTFKTPHLSEFGILLTTKTTAPEFENAIVNAADDDNKTAELTLKAPVADADKTAEFGVFTDEDCTAPAAGVSVVNNDGVLTLTTTGAFDGTSYYVAKVDANGDATSVGARVTILAKEAGTPSVELEVKETYSDGTHKFQITCSNIPAGAYLVITQTINGVPTTASSGAYSQTYTTPAEVLYVTICTADPEYVVDEETGVGEMDMTGIEIPGLNATWEAPKET